MPGIHSRGRGAARLFAALLPLCAAPAAAEIRLECSFNRVCLMLPAGSECMPNPQAMRVSLISAERSGPARFEPYDPAGAVTDALEGTRTMVQGVVFFHGAKAGKKKPAGTSMSVAADGSAVMSVLASGAGLLWAGTCAAPNSGAE